MSIQEQGKFCIIINPYAGNGRGKHFLDHFSDAVQALGGTVFISQYQGHSVILAKEAARNFRFIFAGGGDDTVREVLQGMYAARRVLGILPLGTFNNMAASLYLPSDPLECLQASLNGRIGRIDIGKIKGGPLFIENIGIGLDAYVWSKAPLEEPRGFRRWLTGLKLGVSSVFDFQPQSYTISINDHKPVEIKDVLQITAANSRCYCAGIQIAPQAKINDGLLDICILSNMSKLKFLALAPFAFFGAHINRSTSVYYCQAKKITVDSRHTAPVRVDGMLFSQLPVSVAALKESQHMLLPESSLNSPAFLRKSYPTQIMPE
ncbi:diacylglycerol kinase family lipid kinase [bacterium]|nr:diacylglycerol kinase family lipid kinase [bacterium]